MRRSLPSFLVVTCLLALGASCATLTNALRGLSMPRVSIEELRSLRATMQGLTGEAVLRIDNPNTFPLNLERVGYDLQIGGRSAATGETVKPLSVAADGEALAPIGLRAPLQSAVLAGIEFFQKGQVPYALTFNVHFNTRLGPIKVPVTHEGILRAPRFGGTARNMGVLEDVSTGSNAREPAPPPPSTSTRRSGSSRGTYTVP